MTTPPFATEADPLSRKINLFTSVVYLLFAGWLLFADLQFPVDMLFQASPSGMAIILFVALWFFLSLILAIFPKRILITASILATIRGSFGWPLNLMMGNTPACQIISSVIFLHAAFYLISNLKGWLHISYRPWIRWQHSVFMIAMWIILGVASLFPSVLGILQGLENFAGRYVDVSLTGFSLKERVLEKDGKRIRLTGMIHIADDGFYDSLIHRGENASESRQLVLTEGTSDKNKILPESFASGETYARMAKSFGLTPQIAPRKNRDHKSSPNEVWQTRGFTFMKGDTDISDLSQKHQDMLVRLLTFIGEATPVELLVMPEGFDELEIYDLMTNGLLKSRNDHLMNKMHEQLPNFDEIHMPWGAAHLPDIEDRLLEEGYTIVEEKDRKAIDFWKRFRK